MIITKTMKEQLISFETAKLAKEKGWRVSEYNYTHGINYYNDGELIKDDYTKSGSKSLFENIYDAPTQSLLQKWLREEHNTHITIHPLQKELWLNIYKKRDKNIKMDIVYCELINLSFDKYEEALEKGLQEALKLI